MSAREQRAVEALRAAGFVGATVSAEGHDGDVAAVCVPPDRWDALLGPAGHEAVRTIKALGFRYVALDLELPDG